MVIIPILQEKLKQEQWTRVGVVDQSDIQELSALVDDIIKNNEQQNAIDLCLDILKTAPKSIIALFVAGFCSYEVENKENTILLQQLIEILKDNKKTSILEFVAQKILTYEPQNIYALQVLLQIYTDNKNVTEQLNILLTLLRVDLKNGQIPQRIAEYYSNHSDKSNKDEFAILATKYYQLALRRYAKTQNIPKIEEIWKKLSLTDNNVNYFLNISLIVAEYDIDLAGSLLLSLVGSLENNHQYDAALSILKRLLIMEYDSQKLRSYFVSIYEKQHAHSPQLQVSLLNSGLNNSKEKLQNSIKKFEKEIQFAENGYVFHQVWGVGKISSITEDKFMIDFETNQNHSMSYNMALNSLMPLDQDHIWVLKKSKSIMDSSLPIEDILLTVLRSFPNKSLSIDDLKGELIPDVVSQEKWTSWWNKAKNILKENPSIGTIKEGRLKYHIRPISIALDDEIIEKFQTSKKFSERFKLIEQFMKEADIVDDYADQFKDMVSYFEKVLQMPARYDFHDRILSLFLLQKITKIAPWAVENSDLPMEDILTNDDQIALFLTSNYKIEYKKDLIQYLIAHHHNATGILTNVLYSDNTQLADLIIEQLNKKLPKETLKHIILQGSQDLFRENPIMTFWFLNYSLKNEFQGLGIKQEDIYGDILYRLNTVGKLQEQKNLKWFKNSPNLLETKKIISFGNDTLFKHNDFISFITKHSSKKYMASMYELIKTSSVLNPKYKTELLKTLSDKLPQDIFAEDTTVSIVDYDNMDVIWTSNEGLDKQKKRLLDLENERQANLIELEVAREKGDLRENAEYQAAREKDTLLTNTITELGEQLKKATIIDLNGVSGEQVIPGTTVTLKRNKKKETFSILGFWDTDESNNIIAYNSPLAAAILNMRKGDKTVAEIGGEQVSIEVTDIQVYQK